MCDLQILTAHSLTDNRRDMQMYEVYIKDSKQLTYSASSASVTLLFHLR